MTYYMAKCGFCGHYEFGQIRSSVINLIGGHQSRCHPDHLSEPYVVKIPRELYELLRRNPKDAELWNFIRNAKRYIADRLEADPKKIRNIP